MLHTNTSVGVSKNNCSKNFNKYPGKNSLIADSGTTFFQQIFQNFGMVYCPRQVAVRNIVYSYSFYFLKLVDFLKVTEILTQKFITEVEKCSLH